MALNDQLIKIANAIENSVKDNVENKSISIAFSGGVDSTTLAFLSKKYAKDVHLYTVGFPESQDIYFSIKLAEEMDLPLSIFYLDKEESLRLYSVVESLFGLGFLKSEILAPIQKILEVSEYDDVLFGSGTEELFAGYDRYYQWENTFSYEEISKKLKKEYEFLISKGDVYFIKKLSEHNLKRAIFPFCDESISSLVFSIPSNILLKDKERKKFVLRRVAELLGVPKTAINRPKKALQYGTSIHKSLLKLKKLGKI